MDKELILNALKQEYIKLGLSEKALDGVADILKETITEETKILETVKGMEPLLKTFQSEIDRERGQKSALQKELNELKSKIDIQPKEEKPADTEIDAILVKLKAHEELIAKMTEEKFKDTALRNIKRGLDEKKIPQSYYEPLLSTTKINSETDINELIKVIDENYTKLEEELSKTRFAGAIPPEKGIGDINSMESFAKIITGENKKLNTKD